MAKRGKRRMDFLDSISIFAVCDQSEANMLAGLDGRVCMMTPISEKQYKKLYALYSKMVNQIQHSCGLNPRGYRQANVKTRPLVSNIASGPPGAKLVVDADLVFEFPMLGLRAQGDLTRGVGNDARESINDILEIVEGCDYL
jgi:cleavage and polyadenylation specificity factor subunit 1